MKVTLAVSRLELRKNQLLRMEGARDTTIVCVNGELWITQDEDQRDLVVPAGGSFTLAAAAFSLIWPIPAGVSEVSPTSRNGVFFGSAVQIGFLVKLSRNGER